jgi:hypothetical protein
VRHGDIQDGHTRLVLVGQSEGLLAIGRLPDHDHPRLL